MSPAVDFRHLISVCVAAAQGAAGIIQDVHDKGSLGLVEKGTEGATGFDKSVSFFY